MAYNEEKRKEYVKEYREKNRSHLRVSRQEWYRENKESIKQTQEKYRLENPEKVRVSAVLSGIKSRCKKKGLDCDLTLEDITPPEYCPVFGFKLERNSTGSRGASMMSPSVDRIDPSKGYTKDNIQIISYKANSMKSNCSQEELELFAKWILKKENVLDTL